MNKQPDATPGPHALAVLIAFMRAGRTLDHASSACLLAGCILIAALDAAPGWALACSAAQFVCALLEKVFAWRVALDAELFQVLARDVDASPPAAAGEADCSGFDAALAAMLGRSGGGGQRSMASRIRGARRLLVRQALCLAAQVVALSGLLLAVLLAQSGGT